MNTEDRGSSINRSVGWALVLFVALELITGIILMSQYHATMVHAFGSVEVIRASRLFSFVLGLHHWLSAMLIIFVAVYLVNLMLSGAYRRMPWLIWVIWPIFFLVIVLFQLTGHLLPWDTHAVRTAVTETGIAESLPIVGSLIAKLLRGGASVGPQTLHIWYLAHGLLLPIVTVVLTAILLAYWRIARYKVTKSALLLVGLGILAAVIMAMTLQPPFYQAAKVGDFNSPSDRPEWYILPLHAMLVLVQNYVPNAAFVATAVIPALVFLFILALPWLDKGSKDRASLWVQIVVMIGIFGLALLIIPFFVPRKGQATVAQFAGKPFASIPIHQDFSKFPPADPQLAAQGQILFRQGSCANCHSINGKGGSVGPILDHVGTEFPDINWHIKHLQDPRSVSPASTMPGFSNRYTPQQLKALANYLRSLK